MSTWTSDHIAGLPIAGMSDNEMHATRKLLKVWHGRLAANHRRSLYYGGEQAFKDLGIALPKQLRNARTCLGWPLQAVRKPAARSQFQALRLAGQDDPFELGEVLARNRFGLEFAQATVDANKHGVSFVTVTKGAVGEPDVMIQAHSAEWASATWDTRGRRIDKALTVGNVDDNGDPTEFTVYLDDQIITCERDGGWSVVDRLDTPHGRSQVVPVTHDPQVSKPFGRSRITGPVMTLTDMGIREYARMEGNAEFYSAPQIAATGVNSESFSEMSDDRKFKLAMDRLIGLSKDEDGDVPHLQQLTQASMQPHSDMIRTIAAAFAGETGIPLNSLGIVSDNPSSAEAIRAAEHDLLVDVTYQNEYVLNYAASDIARLAVMVRDGLSEPPTESWKLSASFADPEFRSTSANADAFVKLVSANPDLADSEVLLGTVFTGDQVERIKAELRRKSAGSILDRVMGGVRDGGSGDAESVDEREQGTVSGVEAHSPATVRESAD